MYSGKCQGVGSSIRYTILLGTGSDIKPNGLELEDGETWRQTSQLHVWLTYPYSGDSFTFLKMMGEKNSQMLFPLLI